MMASSEPWGTFIRSHLFPKACDKGAGGIECSFSKSQRVRGHKKRAGAFTRRPGSPYLGTPEAPTRGRQLPLRHPATVVLQSAAVSKDCCDLGTVEDIRRIRGVSEIAVRLACGMARVGLCRCR